MNADHLLGEKRLRRRSFASDGFDGGPRQPAFPARATAFTLPHEFDALGESFAVYPALREAAPLPQLAERLGAPE